MLPMGASDFTCTGTHAGNMFFKRLVLCLGIAVVFVQSAPHRRKYLPPIEPDDSSPTTVFNTKETTSESCTTTDVL